MRKVLILFVVAAFLLVWAAAAFKWIDSRSDYRAFDAARRDWFARCEIYRGQPLTTPEAVDCNRELNALVAEAKRRGWTQ